MYYQQVEVTHVLPCYKSTTNHWRNQKFWTLLIGKCVRKDSLNFGDTHHSNLLRYHANLCLHVWYEFSITWRRLASLSTIVVPNLVNMFGMVQFVWFFMSRGGSTWGLGGSPKLPSSKITLLSNSVSMKIYIKMNPPNYNKGTSSMPKRV